MPDFFIIVPSSTTIGFPDPDRNGTNKISPIKNMDNSIAEVERTR
jgi:hypothetical protein